MILSARVSGVLLVAVACVVVGVAVGRPELIAIVSPVLLIGAWASLTRSRRAVGVEVEGATSEEAGIVTAQALIRTDGEESVLLRASAPGYRSRTVRIAGAIAPSASARRCCAPACMSCSGPMRSRRVPEAYS